jgi:predicted Zn-dependent protease
VNEEFNACAYPDGNVFVNTGLILALQNTSQLASVMAHEIAHVTNKHSKKQYEANQNIKLANDILETGKNGVNLLNAFNGKQSNSSTQNEKKSLADTTTAILGIPKQDITTMLKTYGGAFFTSYYSRELETQADRSGLYFLERAGYDPREASEMWYTLNKEAKKDEDLEKVSIFDKFKNFGKTLITSLYNSHPETIKRAHNIDLLIAKNFQEKDFTESNAKYQAQQKDYTKFKEKLKLILTPPAPPARVVERVVQEPIVTPSSFVPKKPKKIAKKP